MIRTLLPEYATLNETVPSKSFWLQAGPLILCWASGKELHWEIKKSENYCVLKTNSIYISQAPNISVVKNSAEIATC